MEQIVKALIALAVISLIVAVIGTLSQNNILTTPEGWSRASNNLALIAIALCLCWDKARSVVTASAE